MTVLAMGEYHAVGARYEWWSDRFEAEFAQLPFLRVVAQARVILRDAENPLLQFSINGWASSLSLLVIGPFAPHDFTMPADHYRWLKRPHAIFQRLAGMMRLLFQPNGYGDQGHLLPACNLRSSVLFSLDDPQLLSQPQDLKVLFTIR